MKTLLILRHAKSSWKDSERADHDRPLNKRGKEEAPHVGEHLREQNLLPDVILSSTAKRARKTAALAAEAGGYEGPIELTGEFYPGALRDYLRVLSRLTPEIGRAMVVGHNPGLELLLAQLIGEVESLPTAAMAQVELPIETWEQLDAGVRGRLISIWRPKEE